MVSVIGSFDDGGLTVESTTRTLPIWYSCGLGRASEKGRAATSARMEVRVMAGILS